MVEIKTTKQKTMMTSSSTPDATNIVVKKVAVDDYDYAPYDEDESRIKKKIATANAKSSSSVTASDNKNEQQQQRRRTSTSATSKTTREASSGKSPKKNKKKNGGSTLLPPTSPRGKSSPTKKDNKQKKEKITTRPSITAAVLPAEEEVEIVHQSPTRSSSIRTTTGVAGSTSRSSTTTNNKDNLKKLSVLLGYSSPTASSTTKNNSRRSSSKTKMDSLLEENKNWGLSFSKRKSRTSFINGGISRNISGSSSSSSPKKNNELKNILSMASALVLQPPEEEGEQEEQQEQEEGRSSSSTNTDSNNSPTKKNSNQKKLVSKNEKNHGSAAVVPPALVLEDGSTSNSALLLGNSPSKMNKKKKSITIQKQPKSDLVVVATAASADDEGKRHSNAAPSSPPDVSQEEGKYSDDDEEKMCPKKERRRTTEIISVVEPGNAAAAAARGGAYSPSILDALTNSKSKITEDIQRITSGSTGTSFGRVPAAAAAAEDSGDGDVEQPNVGEKKKKKKDIGEIKDVGSTGDDAAVVEDDDWDNVAPPPTTSLQRTGRLVSIPGAFPSVEIPLRDSDNGNSDDGTSAEDDTEAGRGGASSVSSDGGGDGNNGDVEEGVQGELGGQLHQSNTILTAEIVDEETEQNRLKEAEELGRRSVLASAVVAQQVVAVPDEDVGKGSGRYNDGTASSTSAAVVKKNCYRQHPRFWLTAIVVAVTGLVAAVIVAGIVATSAGKTANENKPKTSSSQPPIPPSPSTVAPPDQEETDPEPMSVDVGSYHSGTTNHVCADAIMVADGSRVSFGGRNFTEDEPTEHIRDFEPCTKNGQVEYTEMAWYSLYGTGMDITATVCIDHIDHEAGIALPSLHVYTGYCTGEHDYPNPSVCHDLVVLTDYDAGRCSSYSWSTLEDFEYYIAVADDSGLYMLGQFELLIGSNDSCKFARPVMPDGSPILGSTALATRFDPLVPQGTCGTSPRVSTPGLWHSVIGTGETFSFDTCFGSTGYDFKISVYEEGSGSSRCSDLRCIDGSDNAYNCLLQASVSWVSSPGVTYYVLVHGGQGPFVLKGWTSPVNDICQGATPIPIDMSTEPTMVNGTTTGAKFRADAEYLFGEPGRPSLWCDPVDIDYYSHVSPGVWYRIDDVDAGISISVSACNENSSTDGFAHNIQVFDVDPTGSCDELFCAPATYGSCGTSGNQQQQGQATWVTEQGETYYIFVYGTNEDEVGDFDLKVTSTRVSS